MPSHLLVEATIMDQNQNLSTQQANFIRNKAIKNLEEANLLVNSL